MSTFDTKSTTRHAIVPVAHYHAGSWVGWSIVGKERVEHPAGVEAWGGNRHSKESSSGQGWEVYHLRRSV